MNVPIRLRFGGLDLAHALWAPAILVFALGAIIVLRPFEDAIGNARERERTAAARASTEDSALEQHSTIAAAAARIRLDLRGVSLGRDPSTQAGALLADVQRLTERSSVRVLAIRPMTATELYAPATSALTESPRAEAARSLGERADPFEVRLRGEFAGVVAVIRGLSLLPTPARVLDVQLERHDATHGPAVDATIRLATLRFAPDRTPTP
jgi:hypothetical protein